MNYIKKVLIILMIGLVFLPIGVFAKEKEYTSLNLDEALTEEEIEHDLSNYSESDDKATIYLFRGKGCGYCRAFLTYINSIVDEYGDYFNVVSYEVWYDENNSSLLDDVSSFLEKPASGVPYIVIGDKVFAGYSESYDEEIKAAIKELYDTNKEDRYDVMKEYKNGKNNNTNVDSYDDNYGILLFVVNIVITVIVGALVLVFSYVKITNLENKIKKLEEK